MNDSKPCKTITDLFNSFHNELENIVLDSVENQLDIKTLDTMFEDLDSMQEEYHAKIKNFFREECKNV